MQYTVQKHFSTPKKFVKKLIRCEQRDNRGFEGMRKDLMNNGYYMNTSSYLNASDPNSMRDFGTTRNVVYNFTPEQKKKGKGENESSLDSMRLKSEKNSQYLDL